MVIFWAVILFICVCIGESANAFQCARYGWATEQETDYKPLLGCYVWNGERFVQKQQQRDIL